MSENDVKTIKDAFSLFIDKKYRTFDDGGTSMDSSSIQSPSDQSVSRLVLDQSFLGRSCQIRSNNARYLLYICLPY